MTTPPPLSHREILVVLSGVLLGLLLAALDQTIVATALPTIAGELQGVEHLSWVVSAYLLTATAATPKAMAGSAGTLRVAALPAMAFGFVPKVVSRFLADRPRLRIMLHGMSSPLILDWVAAQQCDIGIVETPIEHPAVETHRLDGVGAVAILGKRHRLVRRRILRIADFADEPFISVGQSSLLRYRLDTFFAEAEVRRDVRVETPLSAIACALVAAGLGVSIVDPFSAAEFAGRLAIRPLEPRVPCEFAILFPRQRAVAGVAREFARELQESVCRFRAGEERAA